MSCVTPVGRILNSEVESSDKTADDSQDDHNQETVKEPLSLVLPQLHSSLPSPAVPPSDQAFLQASLIFQQLREDRPDAHPRLRYGKKVAAPLPVCGDRATQTRAYQLAFNALKYQDLLEAVITDSCFHASQHIPGDLLPLAVVMLYDFQDRRFAVHERSPDASEEALPDVRALEAGLRRCKVKLAASLARCRVRLDLQSVSGFLPRSVRTRHRRAKRLPLCAWVNALQISVDDMCDALRGAGLSEVENIAQLHEASFCRDPLCPDALVFSHHLRELLHGHSLARSHVLNIQDRSLCVAATVLRPLLFDGYDVLVAGSFSAVTLAHVAAVAADRPGRVLVCGADHAPPHVQEMKELLTQMGIKNVRVMSAAFYGLDDWDATVKHVKVIVVLPQCSTSALSDPVSTIHSEHGDLELLTDLSNGSVSRRKIQALAAQQAKLLAHALNCESHKTRSRTHTHTHTLRRRQRQITLQRLLLIQCAVTVSLSLSLSPLCVSVSKAQTVVYCTRSVYPEENEQLVKRVLDKTHTQPKLLPFRVNGPIFPDESQPASDTPESKFFRLEPSEFTNGCFVARLSRQADPTKVESVHDVLARAAAKGLLGGILPEQSKTAKKGRNRKSRADSSPSQPSSPSSEERQTGSELAAGRDPVLPSDGGEVAFKCSEEEEERTNEEEAGERKAEKERGQRRKHKRGQRKAPKEPKQQTKGHKKKRKKSKPRRIPRLTLTLISSAQASKRLSPITAAAHKLLDDPGIQAQRAAGSGGRGPPAQAAPPAASTQARPANTEGTATDADKRAGPRQAVEIKAVTREAKATDGVLPPISSQCLVSGHSKSSSSHTSQTQLSNVSASSSSLYLPGL
ncbi:putative methyltransferase NSUN7 isoform X2 [Betta splendens]|uniref:Methyltransferase NSUN7 isoform X2 n=1 Tax=Betta splendens TaxID=158456 RepID=A0A6P7MHN6_BETSP|nr:putative methyltransferase NSUN7 isoform X2 [Betta splendens]